MSSDLSHNAKVAIAYARAGFFVFPCRPDREARKATSRLPFGKATKTPLVRSWPVDASRDEAQIVEWWSKYPDALVALPCKPNKIFLLDADRHTEQEDGLAGFAAMCEGQDEPMPAHPVTLTDYDGEHHIFRMPSEPIATCAIGPGIETRGCRNDNSGGYFIAPGSRMPDGRGWKRMNGTPSLLRDPLPLPPQRLLDACKPPVEKKAETVRTAAAGKGDEAYARKTLDRVASELAHRAPDTGRDNLLMSAATTMGRQIACGWIGAATVEGRLLDACAANGLKSEIGENKIRDKIKRGIEAGLRSPHEPLPERPRGNGKNHGSETPLHDWDDPDVSLLDNRRGDLPAFPLDVFSPKLQAMFKRTSKGAGVTVAHVAVPFIGIVSGLIGYARRVRATNSWFEPATSWAALIGYSGTGKTPGMGVTLRALKEIQRTLKKDEDKRKRDHQTKKVAAKAAYDKWESEVEKAIKAGFPPPPMPEAATDPGKYVPIRLCVNDATIERLAELLQARPHGIVLVRDELAALFLNMARYSGG